MQQQKRVSFVRDSLGSERSKEMAEIQANMKGAYTVELPLAITQNAKPRWGTVPSKFPYFHVMMPNATKYTKILHRPCLTNR